MYKCFFVLVFFPLVSFAQSTLRFSFDDTNYRAYLTIDTTHPSNMQWQVGKPSKTVFTGGSASTKVLVTDTLRPYKSFDTSSFVIKVPCFDDEGWQLYHVFFWYQLHIDSGTYGKIEYTDTGGIWRDLSDSLPNHFYLGFGSNRDLKVSTTGLTGTVLYNKYVSRLLPDTLTFRFTFIADSNYSSKDGWMIDHFGWRYYREGSAEMLDKQQQITVYPNPAHSGFFVHRSASASVPHEIMLYNSNGILSYQTRGTTNNDYLPIHLPPGIYMLKYVSGVKSYTQRVVIE